MPILWIVAIVFFLFVIGFWRLIWSALRTVGWGLVHFAEWLHPGAGEMVLGFWRVVKFLIAFLFLALILKLCTGG